MGNMCYNVEVIGDNQTSFPGVYTLSETAMRPETSDSQFPINKLEVT